MSYTPQWAAKVIINEVAPACERIFGEQRDVYYKRPIFTQWTFELMQLYYEETISKTVFREMLEWYCWRTRIAFTGELIALKSYNEFCAKSQHFKDCANEFDGALSDEELEMMEDLR